MMEHIQGLIVGAAGLILLPLAWRLARNKLPTLLAGWVLTEARKGLTGAGIENGDLRDLLKSVTMALVLYAERKLPGDGLGVERLDMILGLLKSVSWLAPFVESNDANIRALIDACVVEMNEELSKEVPPKP